MMESPLRSMRAALIAVVSLVGIALPGSDHWPTVAISKGAMLILHADQFPLDGQFERRPQEVYFEDAARTRIRLDLKDEPTAFPRRTITCQWAQGAAKPGPGTVFITNAEGKPAQGRINFHVKQPLIFDNDCDVDDWMALILLRGVPWLDLRAMTITGTGICHIGPAVRNALDLLALGCPWDVPVAGGRESPLRHANQYPIDLRLDHDRLLGLRLPNNPLSHARCDAPDLLIQALRESPAPALVLVTGPLTNLAEAICRAPEIRRQIKDVVVMGGAVDVKGNLWWSKDNKVAEANIWCDPLAAEIVFDSGLPITLVPLDATNHVPMTKEVYDRLGGDITTPGATFIHAALGTKAVQDLIGMREAYFWDPLAAAILADESLATFSEADLGVLSQPGPECGRVVRRDGTRRVRIATTADPHRFYDFFLQAINHRL